MPTARECLVHADEFDLMAEYTSSEGLRRRYLAQAEHWRRLAASPTLDPQTRRRFMADNPKQRGPQDRARINLSQDHEIAWWTGKFGVTEEQLRHAVKLVGDKADDVADHFGKTA
jgi:hypothetical protein